GPQSVNVPVYKVKVRHSPGIIRLGLKQTKKARKGSLNSDTGQNYPAFALNSSLIFSTSTLRITGLKFWFFRVTFRTCDLDLSFRLLRFNRVTAMVCLFKGTQKVSPFAEFAKL